MPMHYNPEARDLAWYTQAHGCQTWPNPYGAPIVTRELRYGRLRINVDGTGQWHTTGPARMPRDLLPAPDEVRMILQGAGIDMLDCEPTYSGWAFTWTKTPALREGIRCVTK